MRSIVASAFALFACASAAAQSTFDFSGIVAARGISAGGPPSWLDGGFGRLDFNDNEVFASAQLGVDWNPSERFHAHVHGLAHEEAAGIVEAYAELRASKLQLRLGQFFLPTSRENKEQLWSSPYTITLSALNSWIAQEFRPIGADLQWRGERVTVAATAFGGNDSMGALLAWRGWAEGHRLIVTNEVVPLPPLFSFADAFADQRKDGTKPFGRDLDGRVGYAGRVRWQNPGRGMLQAAWIDNRGDRELYRGEYAWETEFVILSGELGSTDGLVLAAEYTRGHTGMGARSGVFAQADFYAAYALVSQKIGRARWSARYDLFQTRDRDLSAGESNSELGRGWTLAYLHDLTPKLRGAVEFTQIGGRRVAAEQSGFDGNTDARSLILEVRYTF